MCGLLAAASCMTACNRQATQAENDGKLTLVVGSYASAADEGIRTFTFDQITGECTALCGLRGISNPSFLTVTDDGKRMYAVGENNAEEATANLILLDRQTGSLTLADTKHVHGADPCHLAVSPDSTHLITANYSGGSITIFPLKADGEMDEGQVVMYQYSGPGSQQVLDSWNAGNMGGMLYEQYLAQQGFISLIVDGRGTGGRGRDFEQCTYLKLGQLESHDQVEAALYAASLPYVDASRIGIWGWSYGGFCTLMSMSEGRGVFAAGVAVAAPTDWRYYDSVYTERFMRTPKENGDGYDQSPISRAPQLSGHLLLVHGLADDNVHFRNAAEYTEALVQADKDFRELTYTNRNHSIYGGNTRAHLFRQITSHFKQYLQ